MQNKNTTNIVIAGVGGQGNILASKILAECARSQKCKVIVGEVFGVSQRGGSVASHVRIGEDVLSPISVEHGTDIICGLEPMEALRSAILYAKSDGIIFTNTRPFRPVRVNMSKDEYPSIEDILFGLKSLCKHVVAFDATELAEEAGGTVLTNMVLLGAISTFDSLSLSEKSYRDAISTCVPKFIDKNFKAFDLGRKKCLLNIGKR